MSLATQVAAALTRLSSELKARTADTGWVPLTLASGCRSRDTATFGEPAVRLKAGVVYYRGAIERTSGNFTASAATTLATVPSEFLPTQQRDFQASAHAAANTAKVRVQVTGVMDIVTGSATATYIGLADVVYPLG